MKRVLLVDDDFLVRSYLSQLLNWEANGYELVGAAQDGAQALEMVGKYAPDIVIADIDMPVMNGIDLLCRLKEQNYSGHVIMLSCHDDFEYVKEAMRIGAEEYLLKDMLTPEKLLQTLETIAPTDTEQRSVRQTREQEDKQLLQLLDGTAVSCESIRPNAVIAVQVTEYEDKIAYQPVEQKEEFYKALAQTCETAASNMKAFRCIHVRGGLFAGFCVFHSGMGKQEKQLALRETASVLVQDADRHFAIAVKLGVSDASEYETDVAACWDSAQNALSHAFYQPGSIFYAWQCGGMGSYLPRAAAEFLKKAEELAARRDTEAFQQALDDALEAFQQEQTRESQVAYWLHSADKLLNLPVRPLPKRFAQLRDMVQSYVNVCEEMLPDTEQYSDGVAAAIRFLQEHYRENITLSDAAKAVHLTTAYLSYVFHKETEITFSEYLQSCRINHAKKLLENTDEHVRDIGGMVGYNDNRHFSKVFKRATGMTPQEYRKNAAHNRKI